MSREWTIAVGGGEISGIICRAQWEQLECDWCERVDKPRLLGVLSASCDSLTMHLHSLYTAPIFFFIAYFFSGVRSTLSRAL